ncbi:hypothetical protein ACJX0J_023167, partial [Zea mays]
MTKMNMAFFLLVFLPKDITIYSRALGVLGLGETSSKVYFSLFRINTCAKWSVRATSKIADAWYSVLNGLIQYLLIWA